MNIIELMNKPDSDNAAAVLARRLAGLERRIGDLERWRTMVEGRLMTDQSRGVAWGDQQGERYYHRPDATGQTLVPYLSTTSRFVESLTSPKMVKTIAGEALILGLSFAGLGVAVHLGLDIPVRSIPALGIGGFALSGLLLVIVNRSELHRLVSAQDRAGRRSRSELRVQIDGARERGIDFLHLNSNVTEAQLVEFAGAVLGGASLAVHKWVGAGSLFSRGQYDDLLTELELMGYVAPARGPMARQLTAKGKALMRGLADLGKKVSV